MRRPETLCRLSRRIRGLLTSGPNGVHRDNGIHVRRLRAEPLESRCLLAAVPLTFDTVIADSQAHLFGLDLTDGASVSPEYLGQTRVDGVPLILNDIAHYATTPDEVIFYGVATTGPFSNSWLYEIVLDRQDPAVIVNPVGWLSVGGALMQVNSLEFDQWRTLYTAGEDAVFEGFHTYTVDIGSGLASRHVELEVDGRDFTPAGDIEFDADGAMYITTVSNIDFTGALLKVPDPLDGTPDVEVVGDTGISDFYGLTYDPRMAPATLLGYRRTNGSSIKEIYSINVSTAAVTPFAAISNEDPLLTNVRGVATMVPSSPPELTLVIDADTISETDGPAATTATVTRTGIRNEPLLVTLANSHPGEVAVPASVTIPADASSVTFDIDAVDDLVPDGLQVVTLTAEATGFPDATDALLVTDNETAADLGVVELLLLEDEDPSAGDLWYRMETTRAGFLTLEAIVPPVEQDDLAVTLHNEDLVELAVSEPFDDDTQRIDYVVAEAEVYYVRLSGTSGNVDLRIANLVRRQGSSIFLFGTAADDLFTFEHARLPVPPPPAGDERYFVAVDGVAYQFDFDAAAPVRFAFFGNGDADRAELRAGTGSVALVMEPGAATMTSTDGVDYEVAVNSADEIVAFGGDGADNTVQFADSAGNDTLVAGPVFARLTGAGFLLQAEQFNDVLALGSTGTDVAKLYDSSGNDDLLAGPAFARLAGDTYSLQAERFDGVHAYATAGGTDVAKLYDSVANDTFAAGPIEGALFGTGFYNRAKFFDGVHAYATAGGTDVAKLYDSAGADTFVADPTAGALFGTGFYNRAKFFDGVHAYATAGGLDRAELTGSAGSDIFYGDQDEGVLYSPGAFYNRAKFFEEVAADAASGVDDQAELFDSAMDELLEAEDDWARLSYLDFGRFHRVSGFDRVSAEASGGVNQRDVIDPLLFDLDLIGVWPPL